MGAFVAVVSLLPSIGAQSHALPSHRLIVAGLASDEPPFQEVVIGHSVQGRPIRAITVGHGGRQVVLIGGINDPPTVPLVAALVEAFHANPSLVPDELQVIVLPDVNPDGNAADTRSNANGVDLNRNWPTEDWQHEAVGPDGPVSGGDFAASEPETQALFNFLMAEQPELVISWHAFAAVVEANELPLAAALGELFATISGYEYIQEWTAYPITGEEIVAMEERGIPAFDVELEFEDTESFQRNLDALVAVLAELAAGD